MDPATISFHVVTRGHLATDASVAMHKEGVRMSARMMKQEVLMSRHKRQQVLDEYDLENLLGLARVAKRPCRS